MSQPNFWDDTESANKILKELKYLKSCVEPYQKNLEKLEGLKELSEISGEDEEFLKQIHEELAILEKEVDGLETQSFLGGPFDRKHHASAGAFAVTNKRQSVENVTG